jgi:hypothetical protein
MVSAMTLPRPIRKEAWNPFQHGLSLIDQGKLAAIWKTKRLPMIYEDAKVLHDSQVEALVVRAVRGRSSLGRRLLLPVPERRGDGSE